MEEDSDSFKISSKNEPQSTLIGSKSVKNLEFSAKSISRTAKTLPLVRKIELPTSKSVKKIDIKQAITPNKEKSSGSKMTMTLASTNSVKKIETKLSSIGKSMKTESNKSSKFLNNVLYCY